MELGKLQNKFLTSYIFNPKEVDLPEIYEEEIIPLNIWPKHVFMYAQKRALLDLPEFTMHGTLYRTKQPRLIMTYSNGNKVDVDARK